MFPALNGALWYEASDPNNRRYRCPAAFTTSPRVLCVLAIDSGLRLRLFFFFSDARNCRVDQIAQRAQRRSLRQWLRPRMRLPQDTYGH